MSNVRKVVEIVGLILASVILVAKVLISSAIEAPRGVGQALSNRTEEISIRQSEIVPASWAFAIWIVIFLWQFVWVIYGWTFVCRPKTPLTIFTGVYYGYVPICILNVSWIFLWENEYVAASAAILILSNLVFYPTIASLAFFLSRADGAKVYDIWLTRILVLNGLLFYATWTTIASLITLTSAIYFEGDVGGYTAPYISLSILSAIVVAYFVLENILFDHYLRYAFSVYPVVIWALSAVLASNWNSDDPSGPNIFSLVLLVLTLVLSLLRIILFIIYSYHLSPTSSQSYQLSNIDYYIANHRLL